jgi:hypothetical protein
MSLNCRVFRTENGAIDFVNAPNGNRSTLFDNLVKIAGGNKDIALDLYALTETPEFKDGVDVKTSQAKRRLLEKAKELMKETAPVPTAEDAKVAGFNKGVEQVRKIAEDFKKEFKRVGLQHMPVQKLFTVVSEEIAKVYETIPNKPKDKKVKEAYKAMVDETLEQYNYIIGKGLKVVRHVGTGEPYVNSKQMLEDLEKNNTLKFLPNDVAFGQGNIDVSDNIGLQPSGIKLEDGYELTNSEVFRVVHDYFGHGILGNEFGAIGEENATLQHLDLYSEKAAPAVIFQTRGQNSWVNYSGANEEANSLRAQARDLRKQGREEEADRLVEEANNIFKFAEPKIGIFPNKYNFKRYETARRIKEDAEIQGRKYRYTSAAVSSTLPNISKKSVGRRGLTRTGFGIPKSLQSLKGKTTKVIVDDKIKSDITKAFPKVKVFPNVYEIQDGEAYRKMQESSLVNNEYRDSVTVHTAEEYNQMRMFISEDGMTGVTLDKDGHLGGGFSDPGSGRPNDIAQLLIIGIKEGATNAEAFDTILPDYYSAFGFKAVSRVAFNEEEVPKNWDYATYSRFNNGRPDVVHFVWDGGDRNTIEERVGQFDNYSTYQKDQTKSFNKNSYAASYEYMRKAVANRFTYEQEQIIQSATEIISKKSPSMTYKNSNLYSKDRVNPITGKSTKQVEIELIETAPESKGNGDARQLLRNFLDYTDALGKDVYLAVSPRDVTTTAEGLERLYASEGFEKVSDFEMVRVAKPVKVESFDSNGEPTVKNLMEYINGTNKTLSNERLGMARNSMMAMGVTSSSELLSKLESAIVKNGAIVFDKVSLQSSGVFNKYEATKISESLALQNKIKQSFLELRNQEPFTIEYDNNFAITEGSTLNDFGKQKVSNPFIVEKELLMDIAGLEQNEIESNLLPELGDKYSTNEEFKAKIDNLAKTTRLVTIKTDSEEGLVDKKANTEEMLLETVIDKGNPKLEDNIDFLKARISEEVWEESPKQVVSVLNSIKKSAIENGIDLKNLSAKVLTHSREDVLALLDSMENFLQNTEDADALSTFARLYDEVFETAEAQTELIVTDNEFDVLVDTEKTEYQLFSEYGLVKKQGDVYRQVEEQSLEDLYNNMIDYSNILPTGVKTVEDLKNYVEKQLPNLEVSDYEVDTDNLEKMVLYKTFFKFPISSPDPKVSTEELSKISKDPEYLVSDFIKEFNKWVIKKGNPYFKVTERGIELTETDPISKQEAILSLPEDLKSDLAQYNALSKRLNLELPMEEVFPDYDAQSQQRERVINNPKSVKKLEGDYLYVEDGVLAVRNSTDTFIRTPKGVYEMIYEAGNVKFYGALPEANADYKVFGVASPLSDMDFSKYQYLENSPGAFKTMKKYYTKEELGQIDEEYFSCQ